MIGFFLPSFLMRTNMFGSFVLAEALVSLLLCLVKKCPTVCNANHFVVLLGAYGVTLSSTGKCCMCVFIGTIFYFSPTEVAVCLFQIRNFSCCSGNTRKTTSASSSFSKFPATLSVVSLPFHKRSVDGLCCLAAGLSFGVPLLWSTTKPEKVWERPCGSRRARTTCWLCSTATGCCRPSQTFPSSAT